MRIFVYRERAAQLTFPLHGRPGHVFTCFRIAIGLFDGFNDQGPHGRSGFLGSVAERLVERLWNIDGRSHRHDLSMSHMP